MDSKGGTRTARWNDLSYYVKHGDRIERIAIVGPERWRSETLMFAGVRRAPVEFLRRRGHRRGARVVDSLTEIGFGGTAQTLAEGCRSDEPQKTATPRRGDRRGVEHVAATDGAPVRRDGEPGSADRRKPAAAPTPALGRASRPAGREAAAAAAPPVDGGWPRTYSLPSEGSILVYQPQISSWDKQTHIVAFSAVSYRSKAGDKPALGTIKIEADTKVAV